MKTTETAPGNGRFFIGARAVCTGIAFLVLPVLVACSSANPEIMQTEVRVVASLRPIDETINRRLHVAVDVHDPDGSEDIEHLRVELSRYRLTWERSVSDLRRYSESGRDWLVGDDLALPRTLPITDIRITVEDKSQREAMTEVTVPSTLDPLAPEDFARMEGGRSDGSEDGAEPTPIEEHHLSAVSAAPTILVPAGVESVYLTIIESDDRLGQPLEFARPDTDTTGDDARTAVEIPDGLLSQIDGRRFYLIVERSRSLWLESGPWTLDRL